MPTHCSFRCLWVGSFVFWVGLNSIQRGYLSFSSAARLHQWTCGVLKMNTNKNMFNPALMNIINYKSGELQSRHAGKDTEMSTQSLNYAGASCDSNHFAKAIHRNRRAYRKQTLYSWKAARRLSPYSLVHAYRKGNVTNVLQLEIPSLLSDSPLLADSAPCLFVFVNNFHCLACLVV